MEIWTRPYIFFLIGNKNLDTSWFQFLDLRIKDPDWQNDKWTYGLDFHMDYDIVGDTFFQSRFFPPIEKSGLPHSPMLGNPIRTFC